MDATEKACGNQLSGGFLPMSSDNAELLSTQHILNTQQTFVEKLNVGLTLGGDVETIRDFNLNEKKKKASYCMNKLVFYCLQNTVLELM